MNILKKIFATIISASMFMTVAEATVINGVVIGEAGEDWVCTSSSVTDEKLVLGFDTLSSKAKETSEITTPEYNYTGKKIYISFLSNLFVQNNNSNIEQSISLTYGTSSFNANKIISIKGGKLKFLGSAAEVNYTENSDHLITMGFDFSESAVVNSAVWYDGELKFRGEYTAWKAATDLSKLKISIKNSASKSITDKTEWTLKSFEVLEDNGEYNFNSKPSDGQKMVSVSDVDAIELNFGCRMGDNVYQKNNYALTEGETGVDFGVEKDGNNIKIVPKDGFNEGKSYTLEITDLTDLWNNNKGENETIEFTTAVDGYVPPVVSVEGDTEISIYKGQDTKVKFTVDQEIEKMEIWADGKKAVEYTEAPYEYIVSGEKAGTVTVYAVAYDKYDGKAYSKDVTVTVMENNPPDIVISGITDGGTYEVTEIPTVTVTATDENGLKKAEVYVDERLFKSTTSGNITFTLGDITAGEHKLRFFAEDIYGISSETEYTVTTVSNKFTELYSNDFSDYAGNNSLPKDMEGNSKRGFLDARQIDAAHGKSLAIGIESATANTASTEQPYVGIPVKEKNNTVMVEFDFNISTYPASDYKCNLKNSSSNGNPEEQIMKINSSGISVKDISGSYANLMSYDCGKWYRMQMRIDMVSAKYTVSVDDNNGTVKSQDGKLSKDFGGVLTYLRVFGPNDESIDSFMAVDNLKVKRIAAFPTLTIESISEDLKKITVNSSQALNTFSLNGENVRILDEYGREFKIEDIVSFNGAKIEITTETALKNNTEYKIVLSPDVVFKSGGTMDLSVEGYFETPKAAVDVSSGIFSDNIFNFSTVNTSAAAKTVKVIVQKWNSSNKCVSVTVTDVVIAENDNNYSVPVPAVSSGERVNVFIWDGLISPTPVSNKIWELSK